MDAYEEGCKAAKEGKELWENPYSNPSSSKTSFEHWFAGWCFGKRHGS